jgi:hypothetical protein
MRLLKNDADFKRWKREKISGEDTADQPKEFPCWVETHVQSWSCQEEYAWYLYRSDLVKMLDRMTPNDSRL